MLIHPQNSNLWLSCSGSRPPDQCYLDEGEGEVGEEEVIQESLQFNTSSNLYCIYLHCCLALCAIVFETIFYLYLHFSL